MICFVILHYQAEQETISCIKNIKEKAKIEKKIIIVDNASPNNSGTRLREKYVTDKEIDVMLAESNLGFAKGNNLGFKKAKEYKPDFVVVMNNDVLLEQSDFDQRLNNIYKKYTFDILGPDILSTKTNIHQNPQRNKNYTLQELIRTKRKLSFKNNHKFLLKLKYMLRRNTPNYAKQTTDYTKEQYGLPLHGACYIFSRTYIEKHENCFYDKTFMYYESYILHYLGTRENLKFMYSPELKVLHHEDISTDQTYSKIYNKVLFVNKCLEDSCQCFINVIKDKNAKIG